MPDSGTVVLAIFLVIALANLVAFVQFEQSRKRLHRAISEPERLTKSLRA